jgi:hypothetical protein
LKFVAYLYYADYQRNEKHITMQYYADEIIFSKPIPSLGLPAGETLETVILKLAEKLAEASGTLERELFPSGNNAIVSTADIKHNGGFGVPGNGIEAQKLEGSEFKVKAERGEKAIDVSFDAAELIKLSEGQQIVSTTVNISGQKLHGRSQIANTKESKLRTSIEYSRFPVTLDARVMVATADGDVELRKQFKITSDESIEQATPYEVIDRTSRNNPTNLEEVMLQVDARLKNLETKKANG